MNNPSGEPTGAGYQIHVTVSDDVSATSADTFVVVNNVPPAVVIQSVGNQPAGTISLSAVVTDPGTSDSETLSWALFVDGIKTQTSTDSDFSFRIPGLFQTLIVTATAIDSDGGTGFDSAQIQPVTQTGASVTIDATEITILVGATVVATPLSGANEVILPVYGSNVNVDASAYSGPAQLDGYGSSETLLGGSGNDLITAGSGNNSLSGGSGDDTIISNLGDDSLYGGPGNDTYFINPGKDPDVIDSAGFNTLNFSIAALGITLDLSQNAGQNQIVDSNGDVVALTGQFDGIVGSPNGDKIALNDDDDLVYLGSGNNTITGGAGKESIVGGSGNDIIYGGSGNTTISSGGGHDSILGGAGNDIIYGGSTSSTLSGGSGNDSILAGSGNDIIYGGSGNTTITSSSGNDSITGGSGNDIIYGGSGNTTITGGGGNTTIVGGAGNDIIYGGASSSTLPGGNGSVSITGGTGNDIIYGGGGTNTISGGSGNNTIVGGGGNDIIYGGAGNSTITGGGGSVTIVGGSGNDIIYGGANSSTLTGGSGNVSIAGGSGNDIIYLSSGNNTITGGSGRDSIVGGSGNDIIYGGSGDSTITGGGGNDTLVGGSGNDIIYGGAQSNTLSGGSGNVSILGGSGNDIIYGGGGSSTILGGSGNDSIVGGSADDIIYGGSGNTTITGGGGNDTLIGGSGNDIIYGGVNSNTLTGGSGNVSIFGGSGNDIIYLSSGNNTITGGSGNDSIAGGSGNDIIYGGSGNTTISGGGGNDSIVGGSGNDIIYVSSGNSTITGGSGNDSITGGSGNDIIYGGSGNCTISGGGGNDSITGGSGNDIIYVSSGNSTISGGSGHDSIAGGSGNDIIYGGSGNTTISGGGGNDSIVGGSGNDIIYGGSGDDTLDGGTGNATISGGGGNDTISAIGTDSWLALFGATNMTLSGNTLTTFGGASPAANSSISGFQHAILAAGPGNFTLDASAFSGSAILIAGTGNDTLIGSSAGDTFVSGVGNDSLVGSGGDDTFAVGADSSGSVTIVETDATASAVLDFSQAPAGISINLSEGSAQTVIPGTLSVTLADPDAIADVIGTAYDDTIIGNARDNVLEGAGGEDLIAGLGGNDVLQGGETRTVLLDFETFALPGEHAYTKGEENAIEAQLRADYSAFSYLFTLSRPSSGAYTTIFFNDPALTGLEGGISTSIDWRDQDISGSTRLSAAGLQVTPADQASVNVNNLLGGAGEPAATSANFVSLSATIAAHELGHLSGLEHGDAYGPIGSGIYRGVDPNLYRPAFTGPIDANETVHHIIASGASVNATLFDAINDPFFGEREAISLAFGEDAAATNEQTTAHSNPATAQDISLDPLVVPDTDLEGVNADRIFDVTAADVTGYLGLDAKGNSLADYYSFSAQAGTLINLRVMSRVLDRPGGSFDSTLTVYDEHGNLVAFNDDSFQSQDSTIIDLTLPETGTYYVEVTPFAQPGETTNQTGDYELFMYTFAVDGDPPAGDTMYAGSGNDTIIAGTGDDTIAAQPPKDTILSGSGTMTVASKAPYVSVIAGPNQTVSEGQAVSLTGSFIDPSDADAHSFLWHVVASSGQEIADGKGPTFTFSPGNAGTYNVTYTVSDQDGGSASAVAVITSSAVAPVIIAPSETQRAAEGRSSTFDLGTLSVVGVGPWSVTVRWGDGNSSTFSPIASGPLSLAHLYARPGSYTVSETVSEFDGDSTALTLSPVLVSPAALTITAGNKARVYGAANPPLTVSYSGFVDGDSAASLTSQPSIATAATISSSPGTYLINAAGAVDSNYTISYVPGILSISQDATSVTATTSTASGDLGQSITISARVNPSAPGSGVPTGSIDFFDASTSVHLGSVVLSGGAAAISTGTFSPGSHSITVSYSGDSNFLASSTTTSVITVRPSIIILDPTAAVALSITGNARIQLTGGIYVDSSSSSALSASGNSAINAALLDVHGGVSRSGNASFFPTPISKAAVVKDPLEGLPLPNVTGVPAYSSFSLSGNAKATINPGIYTAISVTGNASLTMNPGIYIIEGGGFAASGNANVTGAGVTIYNAGSKFPSSGGKYGAIALSGNGTFKLSAAATGVYAGLVFIQPASNSSALTFSGNAIGGVSGTIYAPSAQLIESGNAQLSAALIVDELALSGNSIASVTSVVMTQGVTALGLSDLTANSAQRVSVLRVTRPAGLPTGPLAKGSHGRGPGQRSSPRNEEFAAKARHEFAGLLKALKFASASNSSRWPYGRRGARVRMVDSWLLLQTFSPRFFSTDVRRGFAAGCCAGL